MKSSVFIVLECFDEKPDSFTVFKTRKEAEKAFVACIKKNSQLVELTEEDLTECKRDGMFAEGGYELYLKESRNKI